jgi:hypothetical protein
MRYANHVHTTTAFFSQLLQTPEYNGRKTLLICIYCGGSSAAVASEAKNSCYKRTAVVNIKLEL